jgi:hypothetical protein
MSQLYLDTGLCLSTVGNTRLWYLARAAIFSLPSRPDDSGIHPASYPLVTCDSSSIIKYTNKKSRSRGSSVSIVSGYGLDYHAIEVRSPAEAKRIFPQASVSRPALGPTQPPVQWLPGVKRGWSVTLTTHPI